MALDEVLEFENAFKIQNEERECENYALVFWENEDNRDVTFNVIDATHAHCQRGH